MSDPEDQRIARDDFARLSARLWGYARVHRKVIAIALSCMIAHSLAKAIPVGAVRFFFDDVLSSDAAASERLSNIGWLSAALAVAAVIGAATNFGNEYLFKKLAALVQVEIRSELMRHILRLPIGFFQARDRKTGDLYSRLTNDVQSAFRTVNIYISEIAYLPILALAMTAVALMASWQLTLILLPPLIPIMVIPLVRRGAKIRRKARKGRESLGDSTDVMVQTISGIRTVKSHRAEADEMRRFDAANSEYMRRALATVREKARSRALLDGVWAVVIAAFVLVGGWVVVEGHWGMTPGRLLQFSIALAGLQRPVRRLAVAYNNIQESLAACGRLFELLDEPPDEDVAARGGAPFEELRDEIRFEGVNFRYEVGGPPALEGVDLTIRRGETVALVGPSGAGKSTLGDLLARFHRPTDGVILIDGVPLASIDRNSWLDRLAVVSQTPFIFNDTIRENVRYGRPDADDAAVSRAIEAACLTAVVAALPDGLDTRLGEGGATLSGGERQRLAIARAILRDALILILDEATSALDNENERLIQDAIERLAAGRTAVVIAHRLSTVRRADRIVVMDGGRVVEEGTHEELVARGGSYARLSAME